MSNHLCNLVCAVALTAAMQAPRLSAAEPPVIPVGLDAYQMWDRWPYQRIGARAYMRSTYDRQGGNEAPTRPTSSISWPTIST